MLDSGLFWLSVGLLYAAGVDLVILFWDSGGFCFLGIDCFAVEEGGVVARSFSQAGLNRGGWECFCCWLLGGVEAS